MGKTVIDTADAIHKILEDAFRRLPPVGVGRRFTLPCYRCDRDATNTLHMEDGRVLPICADCTPRTIHITVKLSG